MVCEAAGHARTNNSASSAVWMAAALPAHSLAALTSTNVAAASCCCSAAAAAASAASAAAAASSRSLAAFRMALLGMDCTRTIAGVLAVSMIIDLLRSREGAWAGATMAAAAAGGDAAGSAAGSAARHGQMLQQENMARGCKAALGFTVIERRKARHGTGRSGWAACGSKQHEAGGEANTRQRFCARRGLVSAADVFQAR